MMERLMVAYLSEGALMSDPETLVRLAQEMGLEPAGTRAMLASNAFSDDVLRDEQRGFQLGVSGVPFFVIEERFGISGAQPVDVLLNALRSIAATGGDDGERHGAAQCDRDGCAVHQH